MHCKRWKGNPRGCLFFIGAEELLFQISNLRPICRTPSSIRAELGIPTFLFCSIGISHIFFADVLVKEGSEANLSLTFWRNLVTHIQKQLKKASQYNHVIKSAFEQDYPKLLRVIMNLWEKVKQNKEGFNLMFYGTANCETNPTAGDVEFASIKGSHKGSSFDFKLWF